MLAGDVSDNVLLLIEIFDALQRRFSTVVYVPGNHDVWVARNGGSDSLEHFFLVKKIAGDYGICMDPVHFNSLSIVPLLGWYDYSFGPPSPELRSVWMDYAACRWPDGFDAPDITRFFITMNEPALETENQTIISFSHFLPRLDVMPAPVSPQSRELYPVLGTDLLEAQIRTLNPHMHIYGHSHINRHVSIRGIHYINNAYGYPHEPWTRKELLCVFDGQKSQ